ncbi:MAG: S24/S26 family peptidase [Opitutaceae bacterium]|nr:S24/S26 family peptidase [Opitutaceae bacterium]
MAPVFGDATLLVIEKVQFERLQPGMTVAYQNDRGRRVVHQLLEPTASGWRVQGLNNESADRDRVTRENLIGVVYASLATDPSED